MATKTETIHPHQATLQIWPESIYHASTDKITTPRTAGFQPYRLGVRPNLVRLRSNQRRQGVIEAPPSSPEPSLESAEQGVEKVEIQLPPVDGGAGAWKFLFAAFIVEAFLFGMTAVEMLSSVTGADLSGFPLQFGVFQSYWSTHAPYAGRSDISYIGTLETSFYFLGGPFATYLVHRYRRWQRETIWTGFAICIVGIGAASWAPDFGTLVATQGVIFGLGMLVIYYPIFNMMNEWFVERRGLALGVICGATGVSGMFLPFVLQILLDRYGPVTTLRISTIGLIVLIGPVLPLLKPRFPKDFHEEIPKADFSFFKMPLFYCFALAGLLQGMGYYFPGFFAVSYAESLGMSSTIGALQLVVSAFGQLIGQIVFGYVSDLRLPGFWMDQRVPVEILVFISPFVSGIAVLALWGTTRSLGMLIAFDIIFAFFAGGFVVLWARMSTTLSPNPALALPALSTFACMKGVGNLLTGPVSAALLTPDVRTNVYGIGRYENIIVYSGACMMASAMVMVVWYVFGKVGKRLERKGEF
ncbi:MAG: hypothetical protein Q9194_004616, partial [Teloschistes cf. exilis]